ncbi:DUF1559 domain-containing protein [Singulisphaera sp. Ch08]|uniref:DUF1559 domain-containing protein n=1 Tax=Singulisphaera sp. Ch08 TaxID=3120278 RepID=A0AAU7CS15_9BACT
MLHRRRQRLGFTLIELLVVISIIGVLVGLLLPAVNAAREAGRRTQCANNMRQLGLALLNFSSSKNSFPNAGTFYEDPTATLATSNVSASFSGTAGAALSWRKNWVVDILPYLDQQDLANAWDHSKPYWQKVMSISGQPPNLAIGNTALGVLRCPDDTTAQTGQGNLSYAVNGGFTLFHGSDETASIYAKSFSGGLPNATPTPVDPSLVSINWGSQGVSQRLGVMFLGSSTGGMAWDYKTSPGGITDGSSNTLLVSENTLAGYDPGSSLIGGTPTNWACPIPNFCMFIGSPNVCGTGTTRVCSGSGAYGLQASFGNPPVDGPGWKQANINDGANGDFINGGQNLVVKGTFPFSNSGHPSGCNMVFTDGATRFISSSIDGTVYAKMITPAGSKLPLAFRQAPLSQDAFAN